MFTRFFKGGSKFQQLCFIKAIGAEYIGDGTDVCFEGIRYGMDKLFKEMEVMAG